MTLLELMVALTLFAVVMLSTTQIFNLVVQAQRNALSSQNMQEDMRYLMEVITKEIRMAQVDLDGVCVSSDRVYYTDGDILEFMNAEGQCVTYFERDGFFMVNRDGSAERVTSEDTEILSLDFIQFGEVPLEQPRITMKARIRVGGEDLEFQILDFQTSISTRHYE